MKLQKEVIKAYIHDLFCRLGAITRLDCECYKQELSQLRQDLAKALHALDEMEQIEERKVI